MSLSLPRRASAPDDGAPSGDRASSPDSSVATSRVVETLRAAGCVFAEDEAALLLAAASAAAAAGDPADLASMVARRTAGVPLEYVLGWAEFRGHRFALEEGVFVPRHRTGFLVGIATELAEQAMVGRAGRPVVIVDLCCGSGALGAVVAADLGGAGAVGGANGASGVELHAADIEPAAVRCARRNVVPVGGQVHEGDLYDPLPPDLRGRVDVLIANAPYVPTAAIRLMPPEAREHEPLVALDGGPDGLDVLRRVLAGAEAWLAPDGHLLVETSVDQAPALTAAAERHGLAARVEHSVHDEATVLITARRAATSG